MRMTVASSVLGSWWGCSRAVRVGNVVYVSGTAAVGIDGKALHVDDPEGQTRIILERIEAALLQLGASLDDVVATCIHLCDMSHSEAVGRVHREVFGRVQPAGAMVGVPKLIAADLLVQISATAHVDGP